jgi:hypothetical protein
MEQPDLYSKYYTREGDTVLIEIKLTDIMEIFDSFDPSPFYKKVLDANAAQYIREAVTDFPFRQKMKLVIHIPGGDLSHMASLELDKTIRNHFQYRAIQAQREIRETLLGGRISLMIGLAFIILVMSINFALAGLPDSLLNQTIHSSLLIVGWVAMWQPINTFLYAWWPIRRKQRIFEKISGMEVQVVPY